MAYQYADPSPVAPGAQSPGAVAAPAYAAAPPAQYAAPYGYGYGYPPYVDPNELRTLFLTGELHHSLVMLACRKLPRRPDAHTHTYTLRCRLPAGCQGARAEQPAALPARLRGSFGNAC